MHGFGISRRIEQISRGVFKVNPGSLLVALQRLERAGWLDAERRQTENVRRVAAGLFLRALDRGSRVEPGFAAAGVGVRRRWIGDRVAR